MSMTWRARLEQTLLHSWNQRSALSVGLRPLAALYQGLSSLRKQLYAHGLLRIHRVPACVVVVGNVVAGGAGKTPTVIAVAHYLHAKGLHVGIVSRGSGRRSRGIVEVLPTTPVAEAGDEPHLIQRHTQLPVFVGRNRYRAAQALLQRYPHTDVIVCDDGLQHYRLYRDLEICVFDARGTGNGLPLPAGPLREPWPRQALPRAGQAENRLVVLHTHSHPGFPGYTAPRQLADHALRADGEQLPLETLQAATDRPLVAVAAIAQPQVFFDMLRARGITLADTIALPDHDRFTGFAAENYQHTQLLCTEKDAAKLWQTVPDALAIPLQQNADPRFFQHVGRAVEAILTQQQSSPYGYQTP